MTLRSQHRLPAGRALTAAARWESRWEERESKEAQVAKLSSTEPQGCRRIRCHPESGVPKGRTAFASEP